MELARAEGKPKAKAGPAARPLKKAKKKKKTEEGPDKAGAAPTAKRKFC